MAKCSFFFWKAKEKRTKKKTFLRFAVAALGEPSQLFYEYSLYNSSKYLEFGSCLLFLVGTKFELLTL